MAREAGATIEYLSPGVYSVGGWGEPRWREWEAVLRQFLHAKAIVAAEK
jgi:hypothetical protein